MSIGTPKVNTPARIGYARTSKVEQNLDAQIVTLEAAGCTAVCTKQKSDARPEDRRELDTILDFIYDGETLVVTRIYRLARSMRDLQMIVDRLRAKGAYLVATAQLVETSIAADKAFFDMLCVFAEFEANVRRERQADGIAAAKTKGIYKGRPPKMDMDDIKRRLSDGERPVDIARDMGVSRSNVYKAKAQMCGA